MRHDGVVSMTVRRWAAGLSAGMLLAVAWGAPAPAAQPPSVPVPRHDAPTQALSLIGASANGVLVTADDEFDGGQQAFYGGPTGTDAPRLTARDALAPDPKIGFTQRLGVVGDVFAWVANVGRTSTTPDRYRLHRTNLVTGTDVVLEVPLSPVAFTGDAWLAWSGSDLVHTTFTGVRTTIPTGITNQLQIVADAKGALVTSLSPDAGFQLRRYRLDLITFGSGTGDSSVERIVDSLQFIGSVGLSAQTVAWLNRDQQVAHPVSINLRARAGGTPSSWAETSVYLGDQLQLAVGAGRVGYVLPEPTGTLLRVVTGGSATTVPLPAGGTGIAVAGDRFLTAAGGPTATAGVYAIDGSTVSRVATVPVPQIGVTAIAFSGSRLYYADASSTADEGLAIFQRDVSGRVTPLLGDETVFGLRASALRDIASRSVSFSAGRGSLENPDPDVYQWRFFDRGVVTGSAVQTRPDESDSNGETNDIHPVTSGPYTLVRGKVYRPDGSLLFTRPGAGSIQTARDDLFGNRLIYSLADFRKNTNQVWISDLTKPRSSTNPQLRAVSPCGTGCPGRVAIWGNLIAFTMDNRHIQVQNLGTGRGRQITTSGPIQELELGEGVLAWQSPGYTTWLLDLLTKNSKPVALGGKGTTLTLDDHWLARRVADTGRVVVYRMPFTAKYHPRLIGTLAPAGFTPNGDGRPDADTWTPQFDTTKPLTGVTLRIKGAKSGRTLRTLTGTGPDGSIRDLTWDGRTGAGTRLAAGSYRWELTAQAADGEGELIPAHSGRTLTGTVRLR